MGETVLLGGFSHETNTFAGGTTDRDSFAERGEYFGEAIPAKLRDTNTTEGGVIDVAEAEGVDLRYTVSASATPGGPVATDTYEFYSDYIVDAAAEQAEAVDGVVLCLHGAMVPEEMDDGEGPLVARVRDVVGSETPIAVTLDLHGNISDQLVAQADLMVAFETYPHVDMGDTGRRAMRLLTRIMREDHDPVIRIERPPVLPMGPKQNTRTGPMADVMATARELEARDGVLKVNVFPGFHQADVPSMGFSIPVVTDGDTELARTCARDLAEDVWDSREEFVGNYPDPATAVEYAQQLVGRREGNLDGEAEADDIPEWVDRGETATGPVVLADLGDNPGGGGAADGTTVLRELLDQQVTNAGVAIVRDPEVVDTAIAAGVGKTVAVTLGGKTDDRHGDPIDDLDCYVKAITDGEFTNTGPMGTGTENYLGRTVDLRCGHENGIRVLVTENRHQPLDAEIWRHASTQPERLDVLVVKSTNHFRADYEPMASHVVPVNSPGLVAVDPRQFDYEHIDRPKFPLDEMPDTETYLETHE